MDLIEMVDMAEGGEMGSSAILPSLLLEETQFYFNLRSIVNGERGKIRELQKD